MPETNYIRRGFGVVMLTAMLALVYPFIHNQLPFLEKNFRSYSLLENFTKEEHEMFYTLDSLDRDSLIVLVDSASVDSLPKAPTIEKKRKPFPNLPTTYKGHENLSHFLASLAQIKNGSKKVRIGYFGDSMIEGDLVTESLREDLQKEFGGAGVGFVSLACPSPGFRKTIRHSYSDSWEYHTVLVKNPTAFPYGIAGNYAYLPENESSTPEDLWVKYQGTSKYVGTKNFSQAKLYYGQPSNEADSVGQNWVAISSDKGQDTVKLDYSKTVNTLNIGRNVEELELKFNFDNRLPVYGVSFESNEGIYVDNFGVRGNSGLGMLSVPDYIWRGFNQHMDFDLVILHYGLNVIETERENYKGYEKYFKQVVARIKAQMPQTDILIVSVSDKSTMIDGELQTDPSVPRIVKAQENVAKEMQVGFLDLYRGMGGKNTMIKWVDSKWATSDYTHVNRKGAKRISNIIKKRLMSNYQAYLQANPHYKQLAQLN